MSERSPSRDRHAYRPDDHPDDTRYNDRHDDRAAQDYDHSSDGHRQHSYSHDHRADQYQDDSQRRVLSEPGRHPGARFLSDYRDHADRTDRQKYSPGQTPDRVEEVWMKEKQGRISFNDSELLDISRPHLSSMRTRIAGIAGVLAMLGLFGFLAFASFPDLSPEEIIAMNGYGGEQSTSTPFNLASLRDCNNIAECAENMEPGSTIVNTQPINNQLATTTPEETTNIATTYPADTSSQTGEGTYVLSEDSYVVSDNSYIADAVTDSSYNSLQEIPAATTYPATVNSNDTSSSNGAPAGDQMRVLQQWSNVRSAPSVNGDILTSLAEGTNVTLLSQNGEWFEISVVKHKEIIGYMHSSTVATQ